MLGHSTVAESSPLFPAIETPSWFEDLSHDTLREVTLVSPFLSWLLTTPELTTPALVQRWGGGECVTQRVVERLADGRMVRRARQVIDGVVREISAIVLPVEREEWAMVEAPIGPWLAGQGFTLSKQEIRPLLFRSRPELEEIFLERSASWGRSYEMRVQSVGEAPVVLAVIECWPSSV